MKRILDHKITVLIALILFLLLISIIGKNISANRSTSLSKAKVVLSQYIADFDHSFEQIIKTNTADSFVFNANNKFIGTENNYVIILYKNDEASFWSNNSISFPSTAQYKSGPRTLQKLKNVWCYVSVHAYNDSTFLVAVLPIKYTQDIKNNYLRDEFFPSNVDDQLEVSKDTSNPESTIKNTTNEAMFSVVSKDIIKKYNSPFHYVLVDFLLLVALFYLLYFFGRFVANFLPEWLSFLLLAVLLVLIRLLFYFPWCFPHLQNSTLFDPSLFGSNGFNSSLGVFIVNALIFLLLAYYFYAHIRLRRFQLSELSSVFTTGLLHLFMYLFHFVLIYVYKDVILNSTIPLDLTNIMHINSYSIIVYLLCALISMAYIMISFNTYTIINRLKRITTASFMAYNAFAIVVYVAVIFLFQMDPINYAGALLILMWNALLQFYYKTKKPFDEIYDLLIVILFVSLVTSIYSNYFHIYKNKVITQDAIHRLADDRDYVTEFSFTDIHCRVTEDAFLKRALSTPAALGSIDNNIIFRIKQLYLKSYMSKYNLDLHLFDNSGNSMLAGDTISLGTYQELIDRYGFETSDFYLHFIEKSSENYYYSAVIPIYTDTNQLGFIAFNLKPKVSTEENVYPDLLISKSIQKVDELTDASYLVVNNNRILKSKGSIPYEYSNLLSTNIPLDSFITLGSADKEYTIYKPNYKKAIIYARDKVSFLKYVTSYSYIIILFILITLGFFLFFWVYQFINKFRDQQWQLPALAFHDKINITLFSLLIFSFFAIAIITTLFISYQYEANNKRNLMGISTRVSTQLQEYTVRYNLVPANLAAMKEDFSYLIPQLANDEKIDINMFDVNGNLIISSQSSIFEKGLQAAKMNANAFNILKNRITNQVLQDESIGKLTYLSLYMPIYDDRNQLLAYMNIPYFSQTKTLQDEISRFLVALISVYIPLLLVTGLLALFISNSLTKPLNQIGNQLRKIRLGKVNESIQWHQKDEIGLLVDEYNKMIVKLDESATSLKKNERELAWREMAKQIAHEIKNPLTPMRLSIQYLQRAIQEDNPNTPQLTYNMTHTLIEQIDNLSEIATAFASFAQMPTANNEKLDLDHYLTSIISLFAEEDNISINFQSYAKPAWIYADKNQMISLFNNLIKNAIQAIKEDQKAVIDVFLIEEYGTIKTIIMDNGQGISDEIKDRIFTPNFTTKNSGSGLGLAICKQIVENAGGSIWFESEKNLGTSFYVVLPKYVETTNDII